MKMFCGLLAGIALTIATGEINGMLTRGTLLTAGHRSPSGFTTACIKCNPTSMAGPYNVYLCVSRPDQDELFVVLIDQRDIMSDCIDSAYEFKWQDETTLIVKSNRMDNTPIQIPNCVKRVYTTL
jgi:hypothetical protein